MKISVYRAKDKSRAAGVDHKTPAAEMKGVPVRVTTYRGATRTHGAEAVVVITRKSFRSLVASAGKMKLYLSPRAQFHCIEPEPPEPLRPAEEPTTLCHACVEGAHERCENQVYEDVEDHDCECGCGPRLRAVGGAQ